MQEMTKKERIISAIMHQETDRLPMDFWGVDEITRKLMHHFNAKNMIELADAMDIDKIINVSPIPKNGKTYWDTWGIEMRKIKIPDESGYYLEPEKHPLAEYETIEEIERNYTFPTVELWDYSTVRSQCVMAKGYAIEGGYTSLTYMYEVLRGTEQMCIDMMISPEVAEYIFDRLHDFHYAHVKSILEAGEGMIDITQVTDDLGTQSNLMFSPETIDTYLKKYTKNFRV